MSSGLGCDFIETETGEHFYILQDYSCPAGAWDWHEYATCFGPFTSDNDADQHLRDNHANPGGSSGYTYQTGSDNTIDNLIAEARKKRIKPQRVRY